MLSLLMRRQTAKIQYTLYIFLTVYMWLIVIGRMAGTLLNLPVTSYYKDFNVSDWLINYQGGFVRRGLVGESLLWLFETTQFPPKLCVALILVVSMTVFLVVMYEVCKRMNYSMLPVLLIISGWTSSANAYRKDFIILLLAFLVFCLLIKYLKHKQITVLVAFQLTSSLTLLIHEVAIFFIIPISFLVVWFYDNEKIFCKNKMREALSIFIIPIGTAIMLFLCKGSYPVAMDIWDSWNSAFTLYPEIQGTMPMGQAVEFLSWSIDKIVDFHLQLNFRYHEGGTVILYYVLMVVLMLVMVQYIILLNPTYRKGVVSKVDNTKSLSAILLFQIICMIPMFTVLSCDYCRTVLYVVASSIFMHYHLCKEKIILHLPWSLDCKYFSLVDSIRNQKYLSSYWFYLFVVLLFPLSDSGCIDVPGCCYVIKEYNYINIKLFATLSHYLFGYSV